jgi:hypothetical protein
MSAEDRNHTDIHATEKRAQDEQLLAELTAPPSLQDAREASQFWRDRRKALPLRKRAERREAEQMIARWSERLAAAERDRYGPTLLEQLFAALGIRRPVPRLPSRRSIVLGLSAMAALLLLTLILLVVAVVVFWPQLQPIVHTLLNQNGGGGG